MDNGKAPLPANGGFRNGGPGGNSNNKLINVQPPRREDLQPAYAQTLQGESEDAGTHGWYGSMSTLPSLINRSPPLTSFSQYPWFARRLLWCHPWLHRLPEPIQASQPRECRSGHQVRSLLPRGRPRSCEDKPSVREVDTGRREDSNRWYVTSPHPGLRRAC